VFLLIWGHCVSLFVLWFLFFGVFVYFFVPQMYSRKQIHVSSSYWCCMVCWFSFEYFVCFCVLYPYGVTVTICFVVFVFVLGVYFHLFGVWLYVQVQVIALNIVSKANY